MDKKAYIFDLDGTILDSMRAWDEVDEEIIRRYSVEVTSDYLQKVATMSYDESAAYVAEIIGKNVTAAEIKRLFGDMVYQKYRDEIEVIPYADKYIKRLYDDGRRLCVATCTDKKMAAAALKRLGLYDCFEFILTGDCVGSGKQRPDIFLEAARRLNAVPSETCVVEDSLYAVKTAFAAGFSVIAVGKDFESFRPYCTKFVKSYKELTED